MNEKKLFIKLRHHCKIKKDIFLKEITLIVGPRQAGKTTLMMLLKDHLEKKKGRKDGFSKS